jgi:hypothetical protein
MLAARLTPGGGTTPATAFIGSISAATDVPRFATYYPDSFDSVADCDDSITASTGLGAGPAASALASTAAYDGGVGGPWVSGGRRAASGFFGPLPTERTDLFSALTAGRCGLDEPPSLDFPPLPHR